MEGDFFNKSRLDMNSNYINFVSVSCLIITRASNVSMSNTEGLCLERSVCTLWYSVFMDFFCCDRLEIFLDILEVAYNKN